MIFGAATGFGVSSLFEPKNEPNDDDEGAVVDDALGAGAGVRTEGSVSRADDFLASFS